MMINNYCFFFIFLVLSLFICKHDCVYLDMVKFTRYQYYYLVHNSCTLYAMVLAVFYSPSNVPCFASFQQIIYAQVIYDNKIIMQSPQVLGIWMFNLKLILNQRPSNLNFCSHGIDSLEVCLLEVTVDLDALDFKQNRYKNKARTFWKFIKCVSYFSQMRRHHPIIYWNLFT